MSQPQLTPTEKAAVMRAAKLKSKNQLTTPARPVRQAKTDALKNQVWMSEKNPRKHAASNIAEPDVPKQARIRNQSPPPPVNRKQAQESGSTPAPRSAALDTDSESDDFKPDHSDGDLSDVHSGNESDNKPDESDDDILGLDSKKLKATLDYERPQFAPHDNLKSHSRVNSSASSMRSIASTPPVSDNDAVVEQDRTMDSDVEHTGLTSKNMSGPCYRRLKHKRSSKTNQQLEGASKGGKRLQKREQEKPIWRTPEEVDHTISDGPPADEQVSAKSVRSHEEAWPAPCRIVYSNSGKVNLTDQQPHIQDMIRASITSLQKHLLFENVYPELQQRRKLMADILMSCTKDGEEFVAVRKRLAKDPKYVRALSSVPKGRIGSIRGNVRKAAQAHVASHYQLMKGADERVAELLKNNAYIYPVNTKGDLIRTKPFQAPAVLDTIEDAFFSDELAAGLKWHDHLTSTLEDHPDEVELPVAMVALASAAVCSVIMQYSSEKYDRDFNSEMYGGIYRTLVGVLNGIFQASERKFHVLVHALYKSVHGSKRKTDEPGAAESLMFLDIEGMADE
ncbi:hypothetical protein DFH29DRAFT_1084643 [Suillus ampliporus]|nr:hypothetical protein DFH29DRAFT_1084643 [Suillus ampliporus]